MPFKPLKSCSRGLPVCVVSAVLPLLLNPAAATPAPSADFVLHKSAQQRSAIPKFQTLVQPQGAHRLTMKLGDALRARVDSATALPKSLNGSDLGEILRLARAHDAHFEQLLQLPPEKIRFLEQRAAAHSGVAQPDLAGMMVVHAPPTELQALATALNASPLTEWVYFQGLRPPPPCADIYPSTPQYFPAYQGYWEADPGLAMHAAWGQHRAARGGGIRIADCEYWYIDAHEDLCDIVNEPGHTPDPAIFTYGWDNHGGATLGEMVSLDNEYGCTGLVPEAQALFFSEWTLEGGYRRSTAIANAIASVDKGDIVLLEMQASGVGGYVPAEYDPAVWTITKNGTDAGVIVVGAAGNGNENLDSASYQNYMDRGDSGAILVGAGSSNRAHNKLSFSTYGSRVNLQGWGENVFTLGYGSFAMHGGDGNQSYEGWFSGTSSASPFVAACCVSAQGLAEHYLGRRLLPHELRTLLIDTGIPQGSGGHIGPLPNMTAAAQAVVNLDADKMLFEVQNLVAGESATFSVTQAEPFATVYFVYSRSGLGRTHVPALNVTLDLANPVLMGRLVADAGGQASLVWHVPQRAAGRSGWAQAAHSDRVSTVQAGEVE